MGLSNFSGLKLRRKIRNSIWKSEDAIEAADANVAALKNVLQTVQADPSAERWAVNQMRTGIKLMEGALSGLKKNHLQYESEQRKKSPAFPRGISV